MNYVATIRFTFKGVVDDAEARKGMKSLQNIMQIEKIVELVNKINQGEPLQVEYKLQEVFENKTPRNIKI